MFDISALAVGPEVFCAIKELATASITRHAESTESTHVAKVAV